MYLEPETAALIGAVATVLFTAFGLLCFASEISRWWKGR